ncbi:MAG: hypothetical protein UT08_C0009G0013 [Candidatus Woesebacteria bacterium GW2011_GWB1_38_8]|uniref:Uncharacterized protein n=1 Tax=Candidatus Woesebacteria bacterium GW2011_GWB1_38_8 TaxID=1618570 RepID=A0A0G0NH22_9BACT|nr:MAG: hypothetical protein UT08_C0009G0013 [Candidatus Woesebacteria bacterium GW2011_GWB1_38_8]
MDINQINGQLIELDLIEEQDKIDRRFEANGLVGGGGHLRARARAGIKSQLLKELLTFNESPASSNTSDTYSKLINALPKQDDRLRTARRMSGLLARGGVVSPYSLSRCINHKIQKKTYKFDTYKGKVENIIYRTIRKYWKPMGFTVVPVNLPKTGYQLKPI